jgi:hypothetical protein
MEEENKNLPEVLEALPDNRSLFEKRGGLIGLRFQKIAELISRGTDIPVVAEEMGLVERTIYALLRKKPEIMQEAYRLVKERHKQSDLLLVNLHRTALEKLQEALESGNLDIQDKAIKQILALTRPPKSGEATTPAIQQFFSNVVADPLVTKEESLDDIILRKRKERGLPND